MKRLPQHEISLHFDPQISLVDSKATLTNLIVSVIIRKLVIFKNHFRLNYIRKLVHTNVLRDSSTSTAQYGSHDL